MYTDNARLNIERWLTLLGVFVVLGLAAWDVVEDRAQGKPWDSIALDLVLQGFVLGLLVYIFVYTPKRLLRRNQMLERRLQVSHADADLWRDRASSLLAGLGQQIEAQLTHWGLSAAEKQVALLILKGLSFKECAQIRGVSEKTIRQQASTVYQKSGLPSRSALSAFFLEDLLLPVDQAGAAGLATP